MQIIFTKTDGGSTVLQVISDPTDNNPFPSGSSALPEFSSISANADSNIFNLRVPGNAILPNGQSVLSFPTTAIQKTACTPVLTAAGTTDLLAQITDFFFSITGGIGTVPTLDQVTTQGNTTENGITVGSVFVGTTTGSIQADGSIGAANSVTIFNSTTGFGGRTTAQLLSTADRQYDLPDKSGTYALTSDVPIVGTAAVTGNDVTQTFVIPHLLTRTPTYVGIEPAFDSGGGGLSSPGFIDSGNFVAFLIIAKTPTTFTIAFQTPPPAGDPDNVNFNYIIF